MIDRKNLKLSLILVILPILVLGTITIGSIVPNLLVNQIFYALLSLLFFLIFSFLDFEIWKSLAKFFYFSSLILLLGSFFFGYLSRGSIRSIQIGFFSFQSSEFVKPLLVLFFANYWAERKFNWKNFFVAVLLIIPPFILVFHQPDLGSALVILAIFLGLLLRSGINFRQFLFLFFLGLFLLPLTFFILKDYQKLRIIHFLNPGSDPLGAGYNVVQSVIAVGSGKIFGKGFGKGTQSQLAFLPERHTDFIFASFAEEFGFSGIFILLIFYFFLLRRISGEIINCQDKFKSNFLFGFFTYIFFQIFVNIGMNLAIMPVAGITLPLFSYGGNSLLATMISLGMVQNISRTAGGSESLNIGLR